MTFSREWDDIYRSAGHMSTWPWSDVVSYVMRYARPTGPDYRVLELGCGAGANIPFFQRLGVHYCGVEGSGHMVGQLRAAYPGLADSIVVGDFTRDIPFAGRFDLILDRGSLTHNTSASISAALGLLRGRLKPAGALIGIDWFSTAFSEYGRGEPAGDPHTQRNFTSGPLAHTGVVHFADRDHLLELLQRFTVMVLEHKTVRRELPADGYQYAAWNFVATKS